MSWRGFTDSKECGGTRIELKCAAIAEETSRGRQLCRESGAAEET